MRIKMWELAHFKDILGKAFHCGRSQEQVSLVSTCNQDHFSHDQIQTDCDQNKSLKTEIQGV